MLETKTPLIAVETITATSYGLSLEGIPGALSLLGRPATEAPLLTVRSRVVDMAPPATTLGDDHAAFTLGGGSGHVVLRRSPLVAELSTRRRWDDACLLHPFLAMTVAVASRWLGRDAFHAGAFVTPGGRGCWGVLGAKEAGKSSTLAALSLAGSQVVTDDVLVLQDGHAFAGPACIDLRQGAAEALGCGDALGLVGGRERWRLRFPVAPHRTPLLGWVLPEWGDACRLTRVPAVERVGVLAANLAVSRPPRDPQRLLDLATLPMYRLTRPRNWELIPATVELLNSL